MPRQIDGSGMSERKSDKQSQTFGVADIILARAAVDGDAAAFDQLFRKWHPRLLSLARRLTDTENDADDVMQNASITIAKNIRKLSDPQKFLPWSYAIIRRRAMDHLRMRVRDRDRSAPEDAADDMVDPSLPQDERLAVRQALSELSDEDRRLVLLFYVDGFTGDELAVALGLPPGTIKSRLSRIRQTLQTILNA